MCDNQKNDTILYLDCFNGISGDMFIGAMLDLGVDEAYLRDELAKLGLDEFTLNIYRADKSGIFGTKFDVILKNSAPHHHHNHNHNHSHDHAHNHDHAHRGIKDIHAIIEGAGYSQNVERLAKDIFMEIAVAEGKIHGKGFDEVHFHEVGAVDSIVDIVGAAICIDKIAPSAVLCSKIAVGEGTVKCAHGIMPVPAPATLEILKGIPLYTNGVVGELATPTGAAIAKVLAEKFSSMPEMAVGSIGYGLGTKDFKVPNMLRAVLGRRLEQSKK